MKEPPDPHAGRELVQGIENQKSGPWAEAAGGVTRPRAAHTEEHREPCERYPPTETVRAPRQDHAPDHEPRAGRRRTRPPRAQARRRAPTQRRRTKKIGVPMDARTRNTWAFPKAASAITR